MARKPRDGVLTFVTGSSRNGKTAWVKQQLRRRRRVIVWDVKAEYSAAGWIVTRTKAELLDAIKAAGNGPALIAHQTRDLAGFDFWARAAHLWAERYGPCVILAEELADVTSPGKAPPGWGTLCRRVLATGADVYAITQRPAESDKTAIGNAGVIHCHRMARHADRRYMAAELDVDVERVAALRPLEWIERHADGTLKTGKLRF